MYSYCVVMYCTHIFQGPHGPSGAKGEQGDKGVKVSFVMVIKGSYGMKIRSTVSKKIISALQIGENYLNILYVSFYN